ncbi:MAG TPA: hypothetical protein VIY48_03755 [Candidatus Paceibacterota bacterium]
MAITLLTLTAKRVNGDYVAQSVIAVHPVGVDASKITLDDWRKRLFPESEGWAKHEVTAESLTLELKQLMLYDLWHDPELQTNQPAPRHKNH